MTKIFIFLGSVLAGLAVTAGAFASHALREQLTERALSIFETATKYQMYHSLALLFVGLLFYILQESSQLLKVAGFAFIVGIVLFSGSLYGLSLTQIKILGIITPFGGIAFLLGWGCIAVAVWGFKD